MDFSQDLTRDGVTKATIGHGGFCPAPGAHSRPLDGNSRFAE
jgi:hypothetical protein